MQDRRYRIIKPRFNEGQVTRFEDLVNIVPKSVLASDLGKSSERFTNLIDHSEEFTIQELVLLGRRANLTLPEMLTLVAHNYSGKKRKDMQDKDKRYDYVQTMYRTEELKSFEMIFEIIPIYKVAKELKIKRHTLGKMIRQIEKIQIRYLISIGNFCRLSKDEIFLLAVNSYANQTNKKKVIKS